MSLEDHEQKTMSELLSILKDEYEIPHRHRTKQFYEAKCLQNELPIYLQFELEEEDEP